MKKLYIVQFRTDASEPHEQEGYREDLAAYADRIVFVNAITGELPTSVPEDMGGVICGGSGQFYLSQVDKTDAVWQKVFAFIGMVLDADIPFMGICYGGQLLAVQQGADLVQDPALAETGTFTISKLPQAEDDALFSPLASAFEAQLGHKDTPINFPQHIVPLAKSDKVPVEAFRVGKKQAWGLTFHPELNQARLRHRLELFPSYIPKGQTIDDIVKDFRDTPEAAKLIPAFAKLVF